MATSLALIADARDVLPREIHCPEFGHLLGPVRILSAGALYRAVNQRAGRRVNWEEWLDCRQEYARHHECLDVVIVQGDRSSLGRYLLDAQRQGRRYLLLEQLPLQAPAL